MESEFKLDRTAFHAGSHQETEKYYAKNQPKTSKERLLAANYLNSVAFQFDAAENGQNGLFNAETHIIMANIFNDDFQDFLKSLNESQVEYILVGGYSVILHGYSRTTGDMDIWVNKTKNNYSRIAKAFRRFGMPLFDMTEDNFLSNPKFALLFRLISLPI
jgi:hypothetical protein